MSMTRRTALHLLASGLVSGAALGVTAIGRADNLVRPPGAVDEPDFLSLCSRCSRCIDACAPLALATAPISAGLANLGTPVLETNKCILCMECLRACPTGALSKIPKKEVWLGTAVIYKDICLAWRKTSRCKECEKVCPYQAVKMKENRYPEIVAEKCNGCGLCMRRCPTEPKSIIISPEGAKRTHRPPERFLTRIEDRIGPYEAPPDPYSEWFVKRLEKLAGLYGLNK
jgi:ferredoxin-type protein NapG